MKTKVFKIQSAVQACYRLLESGKIHDPKLIKALKKKLDFIINLYLDWQNEYVFSEKGLSEEPYERMQSAIWDHDLAEVITSLSFSKEKLKSKNALKNESLTKDIKQNLILLEIICNIGQNNCELSPDLCSAIKHILRQYSQLLLEDELKDLTGLSFDVGALFIIVLNILSNADRGIKSGAILKESVKINISIEKQSISIEYLDSGSAIEIIHETRGEPNYQEKGGRGLGWTIIQNAIDVIGGAGIIKSNHMLEWNIGVTNLKNKLHIPKVDINRTYLKLNLPLDKSYE